MTRSIIFTAFSISSAFISLLLGAVGVGERDSSASATEDSNRRDPAMPRCVRAHDCFHLSPASRRDGFDRRDRRCRIGRDHSTSASARLAIVRPVRDSDTIFWQPIVRGVLIGFAICIIFALPSLLRFRRISPLLVLRASVDSPTTRRDPVLWFIYALMAIGVTAFSISQSESWKRGVLFAAALGLAIGIFAGVAKLLMIGVRKWFPHRASFVLRQGLANLVSTR